MGNPIPPLIQICCSPPIEAGVISPSYIYSADTLFITLFLLFHSRIFNSRPVLSYWRYLTPAASIIRFEATTLGIPAYLSLS